MAEAANSPFTVYLQGIHPTRIVGITLLTVKETKRTLSPMVCASPENMIVAFDRTPLPDHLSMAAIVPHAHGHHQINVFLAQTLPPAITFFRPPWPRSSRPFVVSLFYFPSVGLYVSNPFHQLQLNPFGPPVMGVSAVGGTSASGAAL